MIYLDHNASTPVRPEVIEGMSAALADLPANPSSLHREGQRARAAIEAAREQVAALVSARPDQVVFTSGGTEGDHLALIGAAWGRPTAGARVAISAVEHHAVHGAADVLRELSLTIDHLPVDAAGRVRLDTPLAPGTTIVSVMLANNETGVLQPVAEIAAQAHAIGAVLHCDAVQAAGKVPIDIGALGADHLVISGHKFGGPKGAGALVLRPGTPYRPLLRGSAHENGRRGGTENLSGIVGLGIAAACAARDLTAESARLGGLRDRFERGLHALVPGVVVHGEGAPRLPNTVNASLPGLRSDHVLMALDMRGIAVSAGAACASGAVEPSPVLTAMGVPRDVAVCAVRYSFGRTTTTADVDALLAALEAIVAARAAAATTTASAGAVR